MGGQAEMGMPEGLIQPMYQATMRIFMREEYFTALAGTQSC
jgi:hypothetical protein